jgi:hypothetical protein
VPVDGFYEETKTRKGKQPHLIGIFDGSVLVKTPTPSIIEIKLTHRCPPVAGTRLHCVPALALKPTRLILDGTPCGNVPENLYSKTLIASTQVVPLSVLT